ncbi:S-adenosyl-L-methionine-dependent methyltransferase [Martensiomyces pterosporus]|nr:S-adenosyl-L-methionine-dependent methyltransferase [Martensiomyces pterosporus]
MPPYFFPPLWEQRRRCIADSLYEHRTRSVLEIGCGDGNILTFLAVPTDDDEHPITRLYGIDIDEESLRAARERLEPTPQDTADLRVDELRVELYLGDAISRASSTISADAIVCSEVIEHIYEERVPQLTRTVFAGYRPRLAVFTTPNAEFNINFPNLRYGTPDSQLRDADHKFEWTRAEFSAWASECARTYGYDVQLRGIGLRMRGANESFVECGGCTQMAVFVRKETSDTASHATAKEEDGSGLAQFASIEYPTYSNPPLSTGPLLELVLQMAAVVADAESRFTLDALWALLEVRQQFKRRRLLSSWLSACKQISPVAAGGQPALYEIKRP